MKYLLKLGFFAIVLIAAMTVRAQGSVTDYQRAYAAYGKYTPLVYHTNLSPEWLHGTHQFWYTDRTANGVVYKLVHADKRNISPLFDVRKLAASLSKQEVKTITAKDLYVNKLQLSEKGDSLYFEHAGVRWSYNIKKNALKKLVAIAPKGPVPYWNEADNEDHDVPVLSPDGKYTAIIKNYNVYVTDNATGKEKVLSYDGCSGNYYSSELQWSPDSKKIFDAKFRPVPKRYIYFVESSPNDQLQPKLQKREYAKPGDELPFHTPAIFDVTTGKALICSTVLCPEQFFLSMFQWSPDSKSVTMEYNQRGHQLYRVLEMNAETGSIRTLVEETSKTFVNYNRRFRYDTMDGKELIWMSERDNHNHLYLYNKKTAQVEKQITHGDWYVREVQKVDEVAHRIYFSASGMNESEDPYLIHYYSIGFDGNNLVALTPEEGNHHCIFSGDMKYFVDTYSTVEKKPISVLRESTLGRIVMPLENADISALQQSGWVAPEIFHAPGRDGETEMWGIIIRPSNFDAKKSYPVIEYIYAGPGNAYTPKDFHSFYWNMTNLTELGFIVVQLDAMGTSFRSKKFEDVCYKNLKDCGFPDRISWMKAAAKKYPYMDISRVGIFGASAGGQEAMAAVLYHPEFYKAAYSSCGCQDNRMDKMWWNEQWMGYPVDSSYVACSNVENAYRLTRPLMLVVGEMDDNVDPSSTYQVVNALIKANKDFDLVVLPDSNHTIGGSFGEHKRMDFFVKYLLSVDPPSWDKLK